MPRMTTRYLVLSLLLPPLPLLLLLFTTFPLLLEVDLGATANGLLCGRVGFLVIVAAYDSWVAEEEVEGGAGAEEGDNELAEEDGRDDEGEEVEERGAA